MTRTTTSPTIRPSKSYGGKSAWKDESYDKSYDKSAYGGYDKSSYDKYEKGGYDKNYDKSYDKASSRRDAAAGEDDRRREGERSGGHASSAGSRNMSEKGVEPRTIVVGGMSGLRVDRRDLERAFGS